MLSYCFGMWIIRQMERFDTLWMRGNENNLILLIRRTSLMIYEISGLDLVRIEWVHSERWETQTIRGQLLCAYSISHHGCATNESIFFLTTLISGPKQADNDSARPGDLRQAPLYALSRVHDRPKAPVVHDLVNQVHRFYHTKRNPKSIEILRTS
jgi:hypothetical protein